MSTATPQYQDMSPQALRQIVEGAWHGYAPTYTHEQRFALAELQRRAEAFDASRQAPTSPRPNRTPSRARNQTPSLANSNDGGPTPQETKP